MRLATPICGECIARQRAIARLARSALATATRTTSGQSTATIAASWNLFATAVPNMPPPVAMSSTLPGEPTRGGP